MKDYFIQYKPFLVFLLKFFLSYVLLTIIYQSYLSQFDISKFEIDTFTEIVAKQTKNTIQFLGYDSNIAPNILQSSFRLYVNEVYVARVVEGCNALSVIILFIAFIIAFKGKTKHTILFLFFGSIFIHFLNIVRIAIIGIALFHFPGQEHILHGVIFPLIIYGIVFILWVIWVNKFSIYATKTATK